MCDMTVRKVRMCDDVTDREETGPRATWVLASRPCRRRVGAGWRGEPVGCPSRHGCQT